MGYMTEETDLNVLFERFITECSYAARLQPQTIRGYRSVFRLFVSVMPEVSDVGHLSTEMMTEFFKRLQVRHRTVGKQNKVTGIKDSTVKTYWNKLHAFFKWLQKKSLLPDNPLSGIQTPEPVYDDSRALPEGEVRKLYAAVCLHVASPFALRRDTAMLSLLLFCGLRSGEFISLEVRDVDFVKQLLSVRGQVSKSKKTRHIPIHPTLLFHLKDYIAERNKRRYTTSYLIAAAGRDSGLTRHGLKHWVKSMVKKSGVKFHLHRFRHTFACNLAKRDVHAAKIQKLLGHSSLDMTMTYLRSIPTESLQEEINRLSI